MTQLILDILENNVQLPESKRGGYTADKEMLSNSVPMISGRTVREVRGSVWKISYQFGFFDSATMASVLAACDKGAKETITCSFLAPGSTGALTTADFIVESVTRPSFVWSTQDTVDGAEVLTPVWANFAVKLRGVHPVD